VAFGAFAACSAFGGHNELPRRVRDELVGSRQGALIRAGEPDMMNVEADDEHEESAQRLLMFESYAERWRPGRAMGDHSEARV